MKQFGEEYDLSIYHTDNLTIPMQAIDSNDSITPRKELQRLSELQHYGAATGLLDFTKNPHVALWFACRELNTVDESAKDARIFILDIGSPAIVNIRNMNLKSDPFKFSDAHSVLYYEPDHSLGARIISQQSVFVIFNPDKSDLFQESMVIPKASKRQLIEDLKSFGISERDLFNDIPGLAMANSVYKPLQRADIKQYLDRGNQAYQARRYEEALSAYKSYAEAHPNFARPHCLIGDTFTALGQYEEADKSYTTAIKNLDRPIEIGQPASQDIANLMKYALYYNRGNVRAATGSHQKAVADFGIALKHKKCSMRYILKNRGNSQFAIQKFDEAYKDFEKANLERKESDAELAMGNCKIRIGDFETALQHYHAGSILESESVNESCRKNADQTNMILKAIHGQSIQHTRIEDRVTIIEIADKQAPLRSFPFAGNRGNTGNLPSGAITTTFGGQGYEGMNGFSVIIKHKGK